MGLVLILLLLFFLSLFPDSCFFFYIFFHLGWKYGVRTVVIPICFRLQFPLVYCGMHIWNHWFCHTRFWKMGLKLSCKGMHWVCWNILQGMRKILIMIMITLAVALTSLSRRMISVSFILPYTWWNLNSTLTII